MIDVTVKIPEERVAEFYAMVGRWLSGAGPPNEVASAPAITAKNWTNSEKDLALAREVWEKLSAPAKAVFSQLIDHPGQGVSGEDLAEALSIPNGKNGVAGVLAWPARYCAALNRSQPWRWQDRLDGRGAYYWFEREVADLFKQVRD